MYRHNTEPCLILFTLDRSHSVPMVILFRILMIARAVLQNKRHINLEWKLIIVTSTYAPCWSKQFYPCDCREHTATRTRTPLVKKVWSRDNPRVFVCLSWPTVDWFVQQNISRHGPRSVKRSEADTTFTWREGRGEGSTISRGWRSKFSRCDLWKRLGGWKDVFLFNS